MAPAPDHDPNDTPLPPLPPEAGGLPFGATDIVTFAVGGPYTASYVVGPNGFVSRPGLGLIDLIVLQAKASDPNANIVATIEFTASGSFALTDNFTKIDGGCTDPPPQLTGPILKVDFPVPATLSAGTCLWSGHPSPTAPLVLVKVQTKRV